MPSRVLPDYLRGHLTAVGLARDPDTPGAPPPFWLEPDDGIPAPGEGKDPVQVGEPIVLAATWAPEVVPARHEGFLAIERVDVWIRSRTVPQALRLHHVIVDELNDRRGWDMDGLRVQESMMSQGLARTGGEARAHTHRAQYEFWYFRTDAEA